MNNELIGIVCYSKFENSLLFLSVDMRHYKKGIEQTLMLCAIRQLDFSKDISVLIKCNDSSKFDDVIALAKYSFTDIHYETYYGSRTFKAEDYATMISTFSAHKAIPIETRTKFLEEIVEAINKCGGEFTLSDKIILCMGRKK